MKYFFLVILTIMCACRSVKLQKYSIINYGFESTLINAKNGIRIQFPGSFYFNANSDKNKYKFLRLRGENLIFSAQEAILTKYFVAAYEYPSSDLSAFDKYFVSAQSKKINVDSLYNIKFSYGPFLNETKFKIVDSIPFSIYNYVLKDGNIKKEVIEQHFINPLTHRLNRLIWVANFAHNPKEIINFESLTYASAEVLSNITFIDFKDNCFELASSNFNFSTSYSYSLPLHILQQVSQFSRDSSENKKIANKQALMTYYSYVGDFKKVKSLNDSVFGTNKQNEKHFSKDTISYKIIDASSEVLKKAEEANILMFNEVHHWPECRAFVRDLLPQLKSLGYNYLALEALSGNGLNEKNGFVNQEMGFYTSEPIYGELIRFAKSLGFKLISYEDTSKVHKVNFIDKALPREYNQAQNIKNHIQNQDGTPIRLVVLCGYDHIHKQSDDEDIKMAGYLSKLTRLSIVSVDLTTSFINNYSEGSNKMKFQNIANTFKSAQPSIFFDENQHPFITEELKNKVDLQVFFPNVEIKNNLMPSWYSPKSAVITKIILNNSLKKRELLQIFITEEFDILAWNAIPILNRYVEKDSKNISLNLLPGRNYLYFLRDCQTNKIIGNGRFSL